MKLGVIGGGAMGEAIIAAVIARQGRGRRPTSASPTSLAPRLALPAKTYGVRCRATASRSRATAPTSSCSPSSPRTSTRRRRPQAGSATPRVVSIMAGVTSAQACSSCSARKRVVRAMPNTPAQIGEGMTVWTATPDGQRSRPRRRARIFGALGKEAFVPEEKLPGHGDGALRQRPGLRLPLHRGADRRRRPRRPEPRPRDDDGAADRARLGALRRGDGQAPGRAAEPGHVARRARRPRPCGCSRGVACAPPLEAVIAAYERSKALGEGEPSDRRNHRRHASRS